MVRDKRYLRASDKIEAMTYNQRSFHKKPEIKVIFNDGRIEAYIVDNKADPVEED